MAVAAAAAAAAVADDDAVDAVEMVDDVEIDGDASCSAIDIHQ